MSTGSEFIEGALFFINVKTAETPIEAFELNQGMETLNDMLSQWQAAGLNLGYTRTNNTSSDLNNPDFINLAVKQNLAIILAPGYDILAGQELRRNAASSLSEMTSALTVFNVQYPDTLPKGAGNECPGFDLNRRFFKQNKKENF